jgi:CspA family cold shock protein
MTVFGALRLLLPSLASRSTGGPNGGPPPEGTKDMITGTVKFFNADKGYGFIQPETGGNDAFVHITAVQAAGLQTLDRDQRVTYDLETDRRGKTSAVNLQVA